MKKNLPKISRILLIIVAVLTWGNLFAQTQTVRGIVLDEANQPLLGVTVIIKGTSQGTATGVSGRFTI